MHFGGFYLVSSPLLLPLRQEQSLSRPVMVCDLDNMTFQKAQENVEKNSLAGKHLGLVFSVLQRAMFVFRVAISSIKL